MKISVINKELDHLTATEKSHVKYIIDKGLTQANSRYNKRYTIERGWTENNVWHYQVKIGTYATHSIGGQPRWDYRTVAIKTDKSLTN